MLAVLFGGGGGFQLVQGGADSELPRTESLLWGYMENKPLPSLLTIWTNSSGRQLCGGREKMSPLIEPEDIPGR
ncbi:hypothetical protein F2P79_008892 [Pimephales promelas]|nr:hypothetical protein F2P79_008892 [Pimephales promelas]